jgi:hypothetical protein
VRNGKNCLIKLVAKCSALVLSLSASVILLQGCGGIDAGSLLGGGGGTGGASLSSLALGFSVPGAPSDSVGKWIFYAEKTSDFSEELLNRQDVVVAELGEALDYKDNEKTQEQFASFLNNVDAAKLTPQQKHAIAKLRPAYAGLTAVTVGAAKSLISLGATAPSCVDAVKSKPVKYAKYFTKAPALAKDIGTIVSNVVPVYDGFIEINDSYDNLCKAAGIAGLSPAEESSAIEVQSDSLIGEGSALTIE